MMKRLLSFALLVLLPAVLFLAGCGPTTQTYSLVVHNESRDPMTIVLCKDGPPMENYWFPPEDIGMMRSPPPDAQINGIAVSPGQTIDQTRSGQFESNTHAIVRVYRGQMNDLKDLLGVGPDSPNRKDIVLQPGSNEVYIDRNGNVSLK